MSVKYGLDAKIYYDAAGVADDVWTELTRAREVTLGSEIAEVDLTTRANGGWEAAGGKLRKGSVELQIPWDPADAGFETFEDAYFGDTVLGIACMDGDIDGTTPAKGLKADMHVLKFERAEPLDGVQMASVTVKPTYSATPPYWWTTLVRALPALAETVVSDYIDLGPGTPSGTLQIKAPALTTTELPDAQTMKYTLQTDDNAAFSSPTALV
ncbi:MAG TPA: hypothetical protein VMX97_12590, partial [Hyphomicrobiaceae bacterium]|nr:hypothetical protein [Hyphomicrobiaceae bacterium]